MVVLVFLVVACLASGPMTHIFIKTELLATVWFKLYERRRERVESEGAEKAVELSSVTALAEHFPR
jgi:hypothetical protein